MSSSINALAMRKAWGRDTWSAPEPFGPDGWRMLSKDGRASIIVSGFTEDHVDWIHASIAVTRRGRAALPDFNRDAPWSI